MLVYVALATCCAALGILITFILLISCQYFGIDITKNLWLITLPIIAAIALNIGFIEMYDRYKRK